MVKVLPAGAVAIPGSGNPEGGNRARWRPPKLTQIAALRCRLQEEPAVRDERGPRRKENWLLSWLRDWPLVFAAPTSRTPGIEWAYENSDMAIQDGSYRFMPAPP
jgi:hypothetical protein